MADVKEKINLLDVILSVVKILRPKREAMVPLPLLSPGLNTSGCGDSCCLKECLRIFMSGWKIMALPYGS